MWFGFFFGYRQAIASLVFVSLLLGLHAWRFSATKARYHLALLLSLLLLTSANIITIVLLGNGEYSYKLDRLIVACNTVTAISSLLLSVTTLWLLIDWLRTTSRGEANRPARFALLVGIVGALLLTVAYGVAATGQCLMDTWKGGVWEEFKRYRHYQTIRTVGASLVPSFLALLSLYYAFVVYRMRQTVAALPTQRLVQLAVIAGVLLCLVLIGIGDIFYERVSMLALSVIAYLALLYPCSSHAESGTTGQLRI